MADHPHTFSFSPTFAQAAEQLLDVNEVEAAVTICEEGIRRYATYATGYLVLARAYKRLDRRDDARRAAQTGLGFAPRSSALLALATDVDERIFNESADRTDASGDLHTDETLALQQLAQQLTDARMPAIDPTIPIQKLDDEPTPYPVTLTIARIYEQQGLITEAITAYKSLAARHDDSYAICVERIAALEELRRTRGGF